MHAQSEPGEDKEQLRSAALSSAIRSQSTRFIVPPTGSGLSGARMSFMSKFRTVNSLADTARQLRGPPMAVTLVFRPFLCTLRAARQPAGRRNFRPILERIKGIPLADRGHQQRELLDLGAVSQATVTYFIERNFKVYTEDLLAAWGAFLEYDSERAVRSRPAPSNPIFRQYPGPSFPRLEPSLSRRQLRCRPVMGCAGLHGSGGAQLFLPRIISLIRDGGAVLAIFHTRPPEQFQRYRVLDAHNLELVPAPTLVQPGTSIRIGRYKNSSNSFAPPRLL